MGEGTRNNGQIRTFWPDDTENEIYLAVDDCSFESIAVPGMTLKDIMDKTIEKWGPKVNEDFSNISVTAKHVHTDCLGYDSYDRSDHTNFLLIALQTGEKNEPQL